jgi:phytoene dehydrogenase-like protein
MRAEGGHDTVIIGGGHNGLVAAFYLARAGLRPLVLERRGLVGGACVTEQFAPGFMASTGAYVISMLRAPIWRDMRLAERGIEIDAAGPSLYAFPAGERLLLGDDIPAAQGEISRFSEADAEALPRFEAALGRMAEAIGPMMDTTPGFTAQVVSRWRQSPRFSEFRASSPLPTCWCSSTASTAIPLQAPGS